MERDKHEMTYPLPMSVRLAIYFTIGAGALLTLGYFFMSEKNDSSKQYDYCNIPQQNFFSTTYPVFDLDNTEIEIYKEFYKENQALSYGILVGLTLSILYSACTAENKTNRSSTTMLNTSCRSPSTDEENGPPAVNPELRTRYRRAVHS